MIPVVADADTLFGATTRGPLIHLGGRDLITPRSTRYEGRKGHARCPTTLRDVRARQTKEHRRPPRPGGRAAHPPGSRQAAQRSPARTAASRRAARRTRRGTPTAGWSTDRARPAPSRRDAVGEPRGISGDVVDECLNHIIESRVRRTYILDRRSAAQAEAFDALGGHLLALASPPTGLSAEAHQRKECRMHNVHTSAKVQA